MGGERREPRGRGSGQRQRWLVCIPMVLLLAGSLSGPFVEKNHPSPFEGLDEIREEISRVLPAMATAGHQLWWWAGTLVPLVFHYFLGQLSQGLWELVRASLGALIDDALIALDGSGDTQSGAIGRLSSTALGLAMGLLLLPVAVRGLEKGLRVVTAILPDTLQKFIAKRVSRFIGKAITYLTLSFAAVGALP